MRERNFHRLTIQIPKNERENRYIEQLVEIAKQEDRTVSHVAFRILKDYLDRKRKTGGA